MFDMIRGLLAGVLQFYAWTVGLGLLVLLLIALIEGAVDLLRDRRRPWQHARSTLSRRNA
jgi:hypothetical protein